MQAAFRHKPENMTTCNYYYWLIIQPALTSCCGFGDKLLANHIFVNVLGHSVSRPNYTLE